MIMILIDKINSELVLAEKYNNHFYLIYNNDEALLITDEEFHSFYEYMGEL